MNRHAQESTDGRSVAAIGRKTRAKVGEAVFECMESASSVFERAVSQLYQFNDEDALIRSCRNGGMLGVCDFGNLDQH